MESIKKYLKKVPGLQRVYRALRWQVHLARDLKGFLWPRSVSGRIAPFGFQLTGPDTPANRAMTRGCFDPEECSLIERAMGWGDTFVDVGANIGLYTCVARSKGLYVLAVEPQPGNIRYLVGNLVQNGWQDVELWPVGVAEKHGLITLYGASGPSASLVEGWAGYTTRFRQTIPVTTLDTLIGPRLDGKRLLVKIDVEGAEYRVLLGAVKTLARLPRPVWMVEICLSEYHPGGSNPEFARTFELFWKHGYSAWEVRDPLREVEPREVERWVRAGRTDSGGINFLFCNPPAGQFPLPFPKE